MINYRRSALVRNARDALSAPLSKRGPRRYSTRKYAATRSLRNLPKLGEGAARTADEQHVVRGFVLAVPVALGLWVALGAAAAHFL